MTRDRPSNEVPPSDVSEQALEQIRQAIRTLVELARTPEDRERVIGALEEVTEGSVKGAENLLEDVLQRLVDDPDADRMQVADAARQLGTLAYFEDTGRSLVAFRKAAELDPTDTWSWVFLGRLHQQAGNLASAERAFTNARAAAQRAGDERDMAVTDDSIGDVRVAQGDLSGALQAYQASLAIRQELAGRDPGNAEWQRDLIVSNWKLADLAERREEPAEARAHWQAALEVARDLAGSGRLVPTDSYFVTTIETHLAALPDGTSGG